MENKRRYEAPVIRKVQLAISNAILGSCHSSPNITPKTGVSTCIQVPAGCNVPPTGG